MPKLCSLQCFRNILDGTTPVPLHHTPVTIYIDVSSRANSLGHVQIGHIRAFCNIHPFPSVCESHWKHPTVPLMDRLLNFFKWPAHHWSASVRSHRGYPSCVQPRFDPGVAFPTSIRLRKVLFEPQALLQPANEWRIPHPHGPLSDLSLSNGSREGPSHRVPS